MKKKLLSFIFAICLIIPCALFVGCTKDKEPTNPAVNEVKVMFSEDSKTLYRFAPDNDETEYTVPDGVTNIAIAAFENCDNLTKVILPSSLANIKEKAFYNCNNLTTIEINSDISIGDRAFSDCQKLSTIDTSKIISYGSYALSNCDALTSVTIAKEVQKLPEGVFSYTELLSTVIFEANSECYSIGDEAFKSSKLTSIALPASCTTICSMAFMYSDLTNITIGKNVTKIYSYAFAGCEDLLTVGFETGRTELLEFFDSIYDKSYGGTFKQCSNLVSVTNFPTESSIVDTMFQRCEKLELFTFANEDTGELLGNTYIGDYAFNLCNNLKEIYLPEHITDLGAFAFDGDLTAIGINNVMVVDELGIDVNILYIKNGLTITDLTYLENFTKQATSDKVGYDMYVRNAE